MTYYAKQDQTTGRLSDIYQRQPEPGDVELAAPPKDLGPWQYDAANKLAVPATLSMLEKADRANLPPRLLVALAIKSATPGIATAAQLSWAQNVIDNVAQKAIQAIQ